jgi:alkylhydroperoxidase family enzyme
VAGAPAVLPLVDEAPADPQAAAAFTEIRAFYARADVPLPFRVVAHDPGYLADLWAAVHRAFADARLSRRLKAALAFAVSLTSRSRFGAAFHLEELRRLGVSAAGVTEIVGVAQMFSSYTKIADTLQLESDMRDLAPVDASPAPGGPGRP